MSDQTYRVGNHQPRNLYRGNEYIGVMFDPADAAMIAETLNGRGAQVPAGDVYPELFRDGDGDWWKRQEGGGYRFGRDDHGGMLHTLAEIKEDHGTWDEGGASE